MSLWQFLEALLMLTNALAILNEDRFLVPRESDSLLFLRYLIFPLLSFTPVVLVADYCV